MTDATNVGEITKHVVRTYEYNPSNLEKPHFIVIDKPYVNTDYTLVKTSGPVKFYKNYNSGLVKMYFDPNEFPSYENIIARLDITPLAQLQQAYAILSAQKRAELAKLGITLGPAEFVCIIP